MRIAAVALICAACSSTTEQRTQTVVVREDADKPESGADSAALDAPSGDASGEQPNDADGDGFAAPLDCNDNDARVHPDLPPDNWTAFYAEPIEPGKGSDADWDYNCNGAFDRKIAHSVSEYECDERAPHEVWEGNTVPACGQSGTAFYGIAAGVDGGCTIYDSARIVVQTCK